ncbi:MAG: FtsW/RodA/SpoVE family cell cycle protein [Eubacteriales bacterium]|nr:FtsW/RodA/SpoVE family cell cycle protein [Eubacteriales bacterium]
MTLLSASSYLSLSTYNDERYLFTRQSFFLIVGIIIMIIISMINYKIYFKFSKIFYYASNILCIITLLLGQGRGGSNRWIQISIITLQPSEILKISIILFLISYLVKNINTIDKKEVLIKYFAYGLIPAGLIAINNLSTGIIIAFISLFLYFIVSKKYKQFIILIIVMILIYIFAYPLASLLEKLSILKDYQLERIFVWKDPINYSDKSYQTMQGLYAIGRGSFFGKGVGESLQKILLPEAQNDMIFAILCEEHGLFGAFSLISLYIIAIFRMYIISINAKDIYGALLSFGIMIHISLQAIFNIAVVTNLLPNTGITLPFVSYGGSSLIIMSFEIGVVLSISRYEKQSIY